MDKNYKEGLVSALLCAFLWGILPIYWKWVGVVDSSTVIFYRIFLVAAVCFAMALKVYGFKKTFEPLKNKKLVLNYFIAGLMITINWSLFIWAVNAEMVIQTSIGYYIEPLVVCIFGAIFFGEKINKYKAISLVFACIGVGIMIIHYGKMPYISITLALTFSIYAALKKGLSLPPILSLFYETIFLAPFALGVIIYLEINGNGALAVSSVGIYVLLLMSGIVTAGPLLLFANAARKTNLFVLGITEYISPSMSLILSIFLFKEPFDTVQLIGFAVIWIGLVFFTYGEYAHFKKAAN